MTHLMLIIQIMIAFHLSFLADITPHVIAAPIKTKVCNGKEIEVRKPGKVFTYITNNNFIVEYKKFPDTETTELYTIKPSLQCPFTFTLGLPSDVRIPKILPQATCENCSPKCVPIQIKKAFLNKQCDPMIGRAYKFVEETIVLGFVYTAS